MDAVLDAVKRNTRGKNEARRLRAAGRIPAVLYGAQKAGDPPAPEQVAVDPKTFMRILHSASGLNTLITLKVQGGADARVLVKNVQLDPMTNAPLHADFYRVNMDRKITVTVPVVLKGESKGVKQEGGVLDFVHREIEVETLPANIPDSIPVDISELGIGDSIHVRDLAANVRIHPTVYRLPVPGGFASRVYTARRAKIAELLPVGTPAPDFALRSASGAEVSLRALRGQVVVLDFWCTWSPLCRQTLPEVQKLHQRFAEDQRVRVLGPALHVDAPGELRAATDGVAHDGVAWRLRPFTALVLVAS